MKTRVVIEPSSKRNKGWWNLLDIYNEQKSGSMNRNSALKKERAWQHELRWYRGFNSDSSLCRTHCFFIRKRGIL